MSHFDKHPINAVCGFLFNEDKSLLALIEKRRPSWQEGFYNGIGGKVEADETRLDCMQREFEEETGYSQDQWESFFVLGDAIHKYHVVYYRAVTKDLSVLTTATDEVVHVVSTNSIHRLPLVRNLHWLIPMAMDMSFKNGHGSWK